MDSATEIGTRSPRRHHDLDALRAWAMAMGIVLHAAWIMIPGEAGAPKTDASASLFTEYLCVAIHTFRMQLFFVMAGLFACLLLRSRGVWQFARNRFLRIALPLVVFWCILCPIIMFQYNQAGLQSGAIQGDLTAWQLTRLYFENLTLDSVMLLHLWFLYYLCWAYVLVMALRGVIVTLDRRGHLRDAFSQGFRAVASRPFAPFVLAAVLAPRVFHENFVGN
jgi:fucose 4-O-acetylase-like acetyltransferase